MTQMQIDFQKAQEIERSNRVKEDISRTQAEAARQQASNQAKAVKLQQEMAGFEKFNKVASGIGNLGKGVGAIMNPLTGLANTGTKAATDLLVADKAADSAQAVALIRSAQGGN